MKRVRRWFPRWFGRQFGRRVPVIGPVLVVNRASGSLLPEGEDAHDAPKDAPDRKASRKRKRGKREYELFSRDRYALDLTNRYVEHLHGLHHWVFTVYAYSIRQAFFLAHEHAWAEGPGQVGIRRIELGRWHRDMSDAEARELGLIREAAYLRKQQVRADLSSRLCRSNGGRPGSTQGPARRRGHPPEGRSHNPGGSVCGPGHRSRSPD